MKSNILILFSLIFISSNLVAQDPLPSDTFKVIKEYKPILINANKISFKPEIDDDLKLEVDLKYSFVNKQVPVSFEIEPIAPAKIKGEPLVKLYNGYARLGVGNSLIPFGEVYYNNLRSKKYSIGGHAKYFNMAEANKIKGSDISQMHFEVFGKRFWKRNTLEGNLSFDRDDFNYYGYYNIDNPRNASDIPSSDLEQFYNRVGAQFSLKSTKSDSFNLRHKADVEYRLISNSNSNKEQNIVTKLNLSQFKNSELYNVDVLIDYNKYDLNFENTIIALKPQISTIGEKFRINAGLGVYMNADTKADFHFYPLAEIKYNVIDDILVPYVGVKGEIRRVNYNSITNENPFVSENIILSNTNEKFNIYGGLRGTLSKKLSFNFSGASIKTEGDYLYAQQLEDTNRIESKEFYLIYDEINELRFKGDLIYRYNEKLNLYAHAKYSSFDTKREEEAWHRPNLKISTSAHYNLKKKILIKLDLIYWGEQYAKGASFVPGAPISTTLRTKEKLDPIFDANLGFEYRYTKRLSAFIQFNNIGGIRYEKYKDYPTQGFNVWGGLTYGF